MPGHGLHQKKPEIGLIGLQSIKFSLLGLTCLALIMFLAGCNVRQFFGAGPTEKFWAGVRPVEGETERLLRNFRYLKAAGRTQLALRELEEAHQRDPNNIKIIDILAQCYEELGAWDRAEELYLSALAKDKDNPALANNLCFSYYQAGRYDKAETCLRELLNRHPQNATVRNNLGLLLAKTGRQDEAFRLWREKEGEARARDLLHQALAALGQSPAMDVSQQAGPDLGKGPGAAAISSVPSIASSTPQKPDTSGALRPRDQGAPASATASTPKVTSERAEAQKLPETAPKRRDEVKIATPAKPAGPKAASKEGSHFWTVPVAGGTGETVKNAPVATKISQPTDPVQPAPKKAVIAAASPSRSSPPAPSPSGTGKTALAAKGGAQVRQQGSVAAKEKPRPEGQMAKQPDEAMPVPAKSESRGFLTAPELLHTRIEIRNGNGVKGIAALHRTWLTLEGFTVVAIGNHIDFGLTETVIRYQPGAERVARTLKKEFFPTADIRLNERLGKDADVQILLGQDQKSRMADIAARIAYLDLKAQVASVLRSSGQSQAVSSGPAPTNLPEPGATPVRKKTSEGLPVPAAKPNLQPENIKITSLTAEELKSTKIELRNGNGVQDQARRFRSELELQGFNVVRIKNHFDFGKEQTTVFYRPGTRRVAQTLNQRFFKQARLEEAPELPQEVDVKIILGHDLKRPADRLARLTR